MKTKLIYSILIYCFSCSASAGLLDVFSFNPLIGVSAHGDYLENKDFDQTVIKRNTEHAIEFWKKDLTAESISKFQSIGLDGFGLQELNLQASKVWDKMLDCNQQDIMEVRKNYFLGQPCGKDSRQSTQIKEELALLTKNYLNFCKSSEIIDGQAAERITNGSYSGVVIPIQHPLLVQIEIQALAAIINSRNEHYSEEAKAVNKYFYEKNFEGIAKPNIGLQHADNVEEGRAKLAKLEKDGADRLFKMVSNATLIAISVREKENKKHSDVCSEYGLWPAINRSIMVFTDRNNNWNNFENFTYFTIAKMKEDLIKCGQSIYPMTNLDSFYSTNNEYRHLVESRRLFSTYSNQELSH